MFSGVGLGHDALKMLMKQPMFDVTKLSMKRPTENNDVCLQCFVGRGVVVCLVFFPPAR